MERVGRLKLILWVLVGLGFAAAVDRYLFGLGAATHLSDETPWGLWVGFDLSAVAMAAGGFVLAATVYVFRLERFHKLIRLVVLGAFLSYLSFSTVLLFELGLPWRIWYITIFWNPHSPLFEVGWCVMVYTAVLILEFFPVPAEEFSALARVRRFLIKFRLPLVILGIMLSTLHQSSLGSLFLIMPYRLFPLWYSPWLPVLFFTSAVALGLMMPIFESHLVGYLYRRKPQGKLLAPLGEAALWVLVLYWGIRFADLAVRGQFHELVGGAWQVKVFWIEVALMGVLPVTIFSVRRLRERPGWQWAAATLGFLGIILNRVDVGGLIDFRRGMPLYIPAGQEVATSLAIVGGAILVFLFMVEHFKVWEERPADPDADPRKLPGFDKVGLTWLGTPVIAGRVKYSLAFVIAAGAGFLFMGNPRAARQGVEPTPVHRARGDVVYLKTNLAQNPLGQADGSEGGILYLDADLTGYGVTFYHQREIERNGGQRSCVLCHHMNMPRDKNSGCYECHRDMYLPTDSFRHDWHASPTGGNLACVECHARGFARTTAHVKPCVDCHKHLLPAGATIKIKTYLAPSYVDAMHQLCIGCHAKVALKLNKPDVARCVECHKGKLNYADAQNLLYRRRALSGRLVVLPPAKASEAK